MNRTHIHHIAALLLFFLSIGVYAQEDWEDESQIDDKEIVIEKDKKIELPIANKNYEKIPLLEPSREYTLRPIQINNYAMTYSPVNPGIRVKKLKNLAPLDQLYGNYIKAGFGNYGTPLVEAFVSNKRSEKYLAGASLIHFSSSKGPVDDENSASGMSNFSVFGKGFTDKFTVGGKIDYVNRQNYFYGYSPTLEVDRDSIKQTFNTFAIALDFEGSDAKSPIQYKIDAGFYSTSDDYDASENLFNLDFSGSYKLSETSSIDLVLNSAFSTYEDGGSQDRTLFRATPQYNFHHSNILFKAGINMVYENDTLSGKDDFHIYPAVEATYPVDGDIKISAGIRGDIEEVYYRDLTRENPWLNAGIPLLHTNKTVEFYGRVKGKISKTFDFSATVSTANFDNFYGLINDPTDSARFIPAFDVGSTSRLKLDGEIGYEYKDLFFLRAKVAFFNYDTDSLKEAWHRPDLNFTLSGGYNFYDKIKLEAQLLTMTGLKAQDPVDQSTIELDGIADLNVRAEYIFSPRASVFVNLYNVFSTEYERYLNYPSRGFMAVGGISYSF